MTRLADELLRNALAETPENAPLHCVADAILPYRSHIHGKRRVVTLLKTAVEGIANDRHHPQPGHGGNTATDATHGCLA